MPRHRKGLRVSDTSAEFIKSTETFAKRGGYGSAGSGSATDIPSGPSKHGSTTAGMKPGGFGSLGDARERKMPPRKGGNAARMVMRVAKGRTS